ncbi:MAG TPA: endonuclease/exonuclease/phosphatase family protein [Gammaproteobacteria bacterium]|nr:endonuclease/exonuclease/phosphatase family protein [Gammaproteobacteria bacterium]
MRLLLYNIRYGLGLGPAMHLPIPGAGFVLGNRNNLRRITDFIKSQDPDIVGLVEVDSGSIRSRRINQAEVIAQALGHYSAYHCKYGASSFNKHLPIVRKQGNAFLAAPRVHGERFHYFEKGIKRLIIELELDECSVFLVHLSLKYRHRQAQLHHLHDLVVASKKPVIVAGDFNTFWGQHEIYLFMRAAGLQSANARGSPSYPSTAPRKELDFVLYGAGITVTDFSIPRVTFSDHLPLICDFEVNGTGRHTTGTES